MNFRITNAELRMPNEGKILRIIDVNINRGSEGLRVVEEICRFILEDKECTSRIKKLRGELCKIISLSDHQIEKVRRSDQDVGRKLYPKSEGKRGTVIDVFRANMKRAQEAVRCLEEFSKLIKPSYGRKFKAIRFKLYELEKTISLLITHYRLLDFNLYVVSDPMCNHVKAAKAVAAGGGKIFQLRDKTASKKQMLKWAKQIRKIKGLTFIVNDYPDIAKKVNADGIHLGQEDLTKMSIKKARKILGPGKIIGLSTHSYSQALKAERLGADYISVGPIFKTPSKPKGQPVGLKLLRKVLEKVKVPVVAIGGIDRSNVKKVLGTGCQRFAVIRAVLQQRNINTAVKKFILCSQPE